MKKNYSYNEIIKAKEILGLSDYVTRERIRKSYLELVKKFHPDKGISDSGTETKIREITKAYKIIEDYINNYEYAFTKEAIARYNPEAGSSFSDFNDPVWGNK